MKAARRRLGYSQKKLARHLCVDPTSIRYWESGQTVRFFRCRRLVKDLLDELDIAIENTVALS
ncbi:MAG: helix-turn-helix transcriptional regulator [bacterium]|nr:helix-turn-helix transcriptional regulator [bacterium]